MKMPHIQVPQGLPGIVSLFAFSPATAHPMQVLAETLLRAPNSLSSGERETIAAFVSNRNECGFCERSHTAAAKAHLGDRAPIVDAVKVNAETAPVSPKLRALLAIAGKVQKSGKAVLPADIERARGEGATDREIHDTVLIAAAFCMYNRYVDGLGAFTPDDPEAYLGMGKMLAEQGYLRSSIT